MSVRVSIFEKRLLLTGLDHELLRQSQSPVRPQYGDGSNVAVGLIVWSDVFLPGKGRTAPNCIKLERSNGRDVHLCQYVTHNPSFRILGDIRQRRPGQGMVQICCCFFSQRSSIQSDPSELDPYSISSYSFLGDFEGCMFAFQASHRPVRLFQS